jgi:alkylhydroperoxidase family enzyme
MPRIRFVEPEEASGRTKEIFDEIERAEGMVPALFRAYALFPELLEANWHQHKTLMYSGRLSFRMKESIMLTVADANKCPT